MPKLDSIEQAAVSMGLVASGIGFAIGVAGMVYVAINVANTPPPSLGPQGEWAYLGVASLIVAGWSFSKAAMFYARRRRKFTRAEGGFAPDIRLGSDGLSIRLGTPPVESSSGKPMTWTWSTSEMEIPLQTLRITTEQVAAADLESRKGAGWDDVCRRVATEYASLGEFEQRLYRQAVQAAVEEHRRGSRSR